MDDKTFQKRMQPSYMEHFVGEIALMNTTYGQPVADKPRLREDTPAKLKRFKEILQDELNEVDDIIAAFKDGAGVADVIALTSIADWLADIIVYCTSEMQKYGLPPSAVLQIVMASNFSKLDADGKPILDPSGQKFLKGPDYWKPEPLIQELLAELRGD